MAQGEFTKEEAKEVTEIFKEVFKALPKTKQREYLGHANDIYLFFAAAERAAPTEQQYHADKTIGKAKEVDPEQLPSDGVAFLNEAAVAKVDNL